ncbi:DNA damage-binding protein 1 [Thecamonas trahens ATCC 50062]|uniref:DNA damage-binding protein 1 n=1 Tax=Thecamonas trahens ATCC 50062 TaxID=461836 RepID=A0A0L0DRJ0_THETB|nr:DNA damage-binding protein 1 [Thecamonas trahens ATCC 50062]KNC54611.1 DNA damage-binding protein 1 [Thecamonas trahens ATCC 50062]|eukprot:XP_013761518.1 DNA damage-binding protein 1 [Thecamonas trahens ATCC 50062]
MAPPYNYVVTAQKPTAVTDALVASFSSASERNLIVCKTTLVEVYTLAPAGLVPLLELPLYGKVVCMRTFRPMGAEKDLLFLFTDRCRFCLLSYDDVRGEVVTVAGGNLEDKVGHPSDAGQLCAIEPSLSLIALHCYDGLLKIVPMANGGQSLSQAFNLRLEEVCVLDIAFDAALSTGDGPPVLAVLYKDAHEARHLKTYQVHASVGAKKELRPGPYQQAGLDAFASRLIPLPAEAGGGFVILGESTVAYKSGATFVQIPHTVPCAFTAFGAIDASGARILVGDHLGNMHVLLIDIANGAVTGLELSLVGKTSIPSAIVYLDSGFVFVGSRFGDSQLVHLSSEPVDESGSYVQVADAHINLGPILDMTLVDVDRQGQGVLVTCSGGFQDGSLRIVRSGIGIAEQAVLPVEGVRGSFTLPAVGEPNLAAFLVVSFVNMTKVLAFDGDSELGEYAGDLGGLVADAPTLVACGVRDDTYLQIVPGGVRLVDATSLALLGEWSPEAMGGSSISVAAANANYALLAVSGTDTDHGTLVLLALDPRGASPLAVAATVAPDSEVACLNIDPLGDSGDAALAAVGRWSDYSVHLLALPSLELVAPLSLGDAQVIPRSALFATLESVNYLLVGMGDGSLVSFVLGDDGAVTDRKELMLGTQPVTLFKFLHAPPEAEVMGEPAAAAPVVFAASDRPCVIYSSGSKLLFSNVNTPDVVCMTGFNTTPIPDALVLVTESELIIGCIDEIQKLHKTSVPLGEMPRAVVHHTPSSNYAVLTVAVSADNATGAPVKVSYLRVLDPVTFEEVSSAQLAPHEQGLAVVAAPLTILPAPTPQALADAFATDGVVPMETASTSKPPAASPAADPDAPVYLVVGTGIESEAGPGSDGTERERGRLIVYELANNQLVELAALEVPGVIYAIAVLRGHLVVAVDATVRLFSLVTGRGGAPVLRQQAVYHGQILALSLRVHNDDTIVVGDLMKSLMLLRFDAKAREFVQLAKDYAVAWLTAVEVLEGPDGSDEVGYLAADNSFNVIALQRTAGASAADDDHRLLRAGVIHLGEFVNTFVRGSLVMQQASASLGILPTVLYGSVSGAIGVIAALPEDLYVTLLRLQNVLRSRTTPAKHFVDGDLVERFLELDPASRKRVGEQTGDDPAELEKLVEELARRLH